MVPDASLGATALHLIIDADPAFIGIVFLSLKVTLTAVALAALVGMPIGAALALVRVPGRAVIIVIVNAGMGLPPVVVGLAIYLLLSRSGPLGSFGLLFSPGAMVTAQFCLVLPIIIALTRQTIEDLWQEYAEYLQSIGTSRFAAIPTLLWDARFSLVTALLAGLGRASAEVGAILVVGGNIEGFTRTMTTAITLETSKGDLPLALALGAVIMSITLTINAMTHAISRFGARFNR